MIGLGLGVGFWPEHSWGELGAGARLAPILEPGFVRTIEVARTRHGGSNEQADQVLFVPASAIRSPLEYLAVPRVNHGRLLRTCARERDSMAAQCNLIIDSCCDLPLSMLQIEGVDTLNFNYVMSDGDHEDDFYQSITPHEFYEKIRNGEMPSTSQASPAVIEAAWRRAAENGIPTVYLCFSSGLSSNYSTAAALLAQVKEEFPDAPLYLVDLMIGSTPEGLLVLEALRQRDSGLSAEELVEWAEQARYFVQTAFMVDDLDALHRGGRIPASVAAAGSALNVKPLLTFDTSGHLALTGAARGRKKGLKQMADFFAKEHDTQGGSPVVLIGNADCPKDAEALRDLLAKQDESITVVQHNIGATIGSHVGPGMVSISFWGGDRRENMSVADRIAAKIRRG